MDRSKMKRGGERLAELFNGAYGPVFTVATIVSGGFASASSLNFGFGTSVHNDELAEIKKKLGELDKILGGGANMVLFKVYAVDTKKLVCLKEFLVCGEDEGDALADVSLDDEQKAMKKRGRLALVTQEIGEFERFRTVAIEMEKDE